MSLLNRFFLSAVEQFIGRHNLMRHDGLYIVALSGGADSVSLLLALKELGYNVEAAHCNFHLRGEESDRDEHFCHDLCMNRNIAFHLTHFDTRAFAQLHKISIEMAARRLRYAYFEQLRTNINAQGICVGHHREDSVETLLINLIRGTGIHGLSGIAPQNGYVLRPLLSVSKSEIEQYLKIRNQPYVTDSTNLLDDVVRNKIRLRLMPLIREINPSADRNMAETAGRIREAANVFNYSINQSAAFVCRQSDETTIIDTKKLLAQVSPEYTLFHILSSFGFQPAMINDVFEKLGTMRTGSVFCSSEYRLLADRDFLIVSRIEDSTQTKEMKIPETGLYTLSNSFKIKISVETKLNGFIVDRSKNTATLDADKVQFPLLIRRIKTGDKFIPFGMKGRKLVSDYLTDRKFSLFQKERQLVITDKNGEILWIVGERPDNRFRLTSGTTKVLIINRLTE